MIICRGLLCEFWIGSGCICSVIQRGDLGIEESGPESGPESVDDACSCCSFCDYCFFHWA